MINDFSNMEEFNDFFQSEDKCRKYFEDVRFKDGDF